MNYLSQLEKRNKLIDDADELMSIYTQIADELYFKSASRKYSSIINIEIEEDGIYYTYYCNSYDYSTGTDSFFVSKDNLEKLSVKYIRKTKLNKIKNSK